MLLVISPDTRNLGYTRIEVNSGLAEHGFFVFGEIDDCMHIVTMDLRFSETS